MANSLLLLLVLLIVLLVLLIVLLVLLIVLLVLLILLLVYDDEETDHATLPVDGEQAGAALQLDCALI